MSMPNLVEPIKYSFFSEELFLAKEYEISKLPNTDLKTEKIGIAILIDYPLTRKSCGEKKIYSFLPITEIEKLKKHEKTHLIFDAIRTGKIAFTICNESEQIEKILIQQDYQAIFKEKIALGLATFRSDKTIGNYISLPNPAYTKLFDTTDVRTLEKTILGAGFYWEKQNKNLNDIIQKKINELKQKYSNDIKEESDKTALIKFYRACEWCKKYSPEELVAELYEIGDEVKRRIPYPNNFEIKELNDVKVFYFVPEEFNSIYKQSNPQDEIKNLFTLKIHGPKKQREKNETTSPSCLKITETIPSSTSQVVQDQHPSDQPVQSNSSTEKKKRKKIPVQPCLRKFKQKQPKPDKKLEKKNSTNKPKVPSHYVNPTQKKNTKNTTQLQISN